MRRAATVDDRLGRPGGNAQAKQAQSTRRSQRNWFAQDIAKRTAHVILRSFVQRWMYWQAQEKS
jgi:hypothetical protein